MKKNSQDAELRLISLIDRTGEGEEPDLSAIMEIIGFNEKKFRAFIKEFNLQNDSDAMEMLQYMMTEREGQRDGILVEET